MNDIFWKATDKELGDFFWNLTDDEAQAFFDRYLQTRDERLKVLNRHFFETGGGNEDSLDFSPESLVSLWRWAKKHIHKRDFTQKELERILPLPEWFREENLRNKPLSEESRILLNDIAYYFGEVVVRNLKGAHWALCRTKVKRFVDENQPVIGGFTIPINPRDKVRMASRKTLSDEAGDEALLDGYEKCANLTEAK